MLWPDTSFNHVPAELPGWSNASTILGMTMIEITTVGLVLSMTKRHWLSVPIGLAIGQYLIVGNLILPIATFAANRLVLPMVLSPAILGAAAIDHLTKRRGLPRSAVLILYVLLLLVMAFPVLRANGHWSSTLRRMQADAYAQPDNPIAIYHLGVAHAKAAQPRDPGDQAQHLRKQAIEYLQSAVQRRPTSIQARRYLAKAANVAGYFPLAQKQYQWILDQPSHEHDLEALTNLAAIAMIQQKYPMADHYLRFAVDIDPTHPDVMHNLAVLALMQSDLDLALERYTALLDRYPDHPLGLEQIEQVRDALKRRRQD